MTAPPIDQQLDIFAPPYTVEEVISTRARQVRLEVRSATSVRLVIPRHASKLAARAFLASRHSWIEEQCAKLQRRAADTPLDSGLMRWDGNDHIPLRGVDHRVLLTAATLKAPMVRIEPGALHLFAASSTLAMPRVLRGHLVRALRHEAEKDAAPLLATEAARLGVNPRRLRLGDQRSLWGSCTADGSIQLSWRLIMAPPEVLRYVVIHEVCHLVHRDHSDAFWALVARQCPDYRPSYDWLRHHGLRLHHLLSH